MPGVQRRRPSTAVAAVAAFVGHAEQEAEDPPNSVALPEVEGERRGLGGPSLEHHPEDSDP